jgi:hypothetical protein
MRGPWLLGADLILFEIILDLRACTVSANIRQNRMNANPKIKPICFSVEPYIWYKLFCLVHSYESRPY